jgi:hypothetical protein
MANIYVAASATWNGKALKKAKKDVSVFDQQVKSLGKTFAGVFGARALFNYGKNAVKAFAADEAAAKALELQLRNTGNAFAAPAVEYYIANLQKTTGVLDDQLRPAFQQLLTVTNSVAQSQAALDTALNVSAATGKSLTEVAAALSKGFAGNTTALTRLGAGLDKATLKGGKMDDILKQLNQKFAGQAAARLDTYAGKMSLLQVAAADASETIGKSLIDALNKLGKNEDIKDLTDDINKMAVGIASVISGLGELTSVLSTLRQTTGFKQLFDILFGTNIFSLLGKLGEISAPAPTSNFTYSLGPSAIKDVERANLILAANKARATENKLIKEKNALEALKMKYDVERIGLMLALNTATDEETRLRIAEKLAILDGNAAKAKQYLADLELTSTMGVLTNATNAAATALANLSKSPALVTPTGELTARGRNQIAPMEGELPSGQLYGLPSQMSAPAAATAAAPVIINVPVNAGTIIAEQELQGLITDTVRVALKSGNKLVPAGSIT